MNLLGGRKATLVLIAMALVATHDLLGLDHDTIQQIVILALGGSGAIALEDMLGNRGGKRKTALK